MRGAALLGTLKEQLLPAAEVFQPELLPVSAGFDAMAGDPLADLRLIPADITARSRLMLAIAARHWGGRLVSVLEGGDDLVTLAAESVAPGRALPEASSAEGATHNARG